MRATSYVLAFAAVAATLALNILSLTKPNWLYVHSPDIFHTKFVITYGLLERCERSTIELPGSGHYEDYKCRPFPTHTDDHCDGENREFCALWWTARGAVALSIALGGVAALGLVLGVTTRSRRRRSWKSAASLVALQAVSQIVAFGIVTDLYRAGRYAPFEYARPSTAYVLNAVSWVANVLIFFGIVVTGIAADSGHEWASGNMGYRPVHG